MAKFSVQRGTTSKIVHVFIQDSSQTTGVGLTGLVYNSAGLSWYFAIEGGTSTVVTLATAVLGTWTSGGFKEMDATNMPGWYELGLPNTTISGGSNSAAYVSMHLQGASNMSPCAFEIELTGNNNQDGVRGGITALPNANAASAGGLPTVTSGSGSFQIHIDGNGNAYVANGTGTGQINLSSGNVTVAGYAASQDPGTSVWNTSIPGAFAAGKAGNILGNNIPANVLQINSQTASASGTVIFPTGTILSGGTGANQVSTSSGVVSANLTQIAGQATNGTATAGAGGSITLATSAAGLIGQVILLTGGTGQGQYNVIAAASGSGNKVATMLYGWSGSIPDATTTYTILPLPGGTIVEALTSGLTPNVNVTNIAGTAIASNVPAGFNYFFNVGTPAQTMNNVGGTTVTSVITSGTAQGGTSTTIQLAAGEPSQTNGFVGANVSIPTAGGTGAGQTRVITAYNTSTKTATVDRNWDTTPDSTSKYVITPAGIYSATGSAVSVNVAQWASANVATPNVAGVPIADLGYTLGTASAGQAGSVGIDWAQVANKTAMVALTNTTVSANTAMTSGTAQAGTSTTITLASGEPATNNIFQNCTIATTGGTGPKQSATIASYVGSTKVATINGTWATTPDSSTTYAIYPQGAVTVGNYLTAALTAFWSYSQSTWAGLAVSTVGGWLYSRLKLLTGGSSIALTNPVSNSGLIQLVQGGAYLYASGTGVVFAIDGTVTDLTGVTVKLGLKDQTGGSGTASLVVTGTVHDAGLVTQTISFDLTSTQTAALDVDPDVSHPFRPGSYAYTYEVKTGAVASNCLSLATGDCSVSAGSLACS